jgi:hypothetical protein
LNNKAVIAVGIAIVIGVAGFILLFSSYVTSPSTAASATTRDGSLRFSIMDLKDTYAIDEPLNFTVSITGYGYFCLDPRAKVLDAESRELVFDIPEADMQVFCIPEPRDVDVTLRLEDMISPNEPVILGEPGRYILVIEFEGASAEKEFTIRSDYLMN